MKKGINAVWFRKPHRQQRAVLQTVELDETLRVMEANRVRLETDVRMGRRKAFTF
jgi:hypothetical protein